MILTPPPPAAVVNHVGTLRLIPAVPTLPSNTEPSVDTVDKLNPAALTDAVTVVVEPAVDTPNVIPLPSLYTRLPALLGIFISN